MPVPRRFRPFLSQASNEGLVRFGGERDVLSAALAQAAQSYRQGIAQARSAAAIIGEATRNQQNALSDPSNPITSLAQQYRGATGSEGAIVARNLGLTADAARTLLGSHQVQAADAAAYQGQALHRQYLSDLAKVQQGQAGLADRYGAYVTGRYDSLVGADRKQRHDANQQARDLKASFIKAGVNPQTGKVVSGGPKDPTLSPSSQKSAADLEYFRRHGYYPPTGPPKPAKAAKGKAKFTQADINKSLRTFRGGLQIAAQYDLKSVLKGPKQQMVQDVARTLNQGLKGANGTVFGTVIKDPVLAQAAAERYVYGYVSEATNRKLIDQYGFAAKTNAPSRRVSPEVRRNAERLRKRPT